MSDNPDVNIKEKIKSFLIVGETLDGVYSFEEVILVNLLTFVVLLISSVVTLIQAISFGSFWWLLTIGFFLGSVYFLLIVRINITYAITKFRIIRIENDIISQWFFKSSRLIGFTDLHYEHIESIHVGSPKLNLTRFYVSLLGITVGWFIVAQNLFPNGGIGFINLIAVLIIVAGVLNILFSLPLGGVRLIIQSISGDTMEFPESDTPAEFVDDLILNCRTFLSYGAS